MRWTSTAPDLSSLSERVSEIVSTAIFSGTNCLVSSSPGIGTPLLTPTLRPPAARCKAPGGSPALHRIAGAFLRRLDVAAGVKERQVVDDLEAAAQQKRQARKGRSKQRTGKGRAERGGKAARHRRDARGRCALLGRHHGHDVGGTR